ncbi:hypothetical protein OKA04_20835 [Luteolibacter flavescens]|uniref:Uncharacterized protein n=1 Tax=Luteolibacter flavescens TaxID=1859460 RepID=A0ABT3FUV1_9BACT|nr:hypothetical protein [Luteolibacter flavescens]MCW1887197.1 hypothetical protein [Luteolibacter flavescens]
MDTIEQPVNLGAFSDPSAIPLGPVPVESNHGYDVHKVISAPRPVQHGAMEWKQGNLLDQNLAHVFGIMVDPLDTLHPLSMPVYLRVKAWPVPAYSPYTREQVMAATLHCLLRSTGSTPKAPLKIEVVTDDPADKSWSDKFVGSYFTHPDWDGPQVEPTPVPGGGRIETDRFGVAWVIFDHVKKPKTPPSRPPVFIPFHLGGESNSGLSWAILPVWAGDTFEKPLDILGQPYKLYYDRSNPAEVGTSDVNALFEVRTSIFWSTEEGAHGTSVSLDFGDMDPGNLAAFLQALVFSVRPTTEKPLTVTLTALNKRPAYFQACLDAGGWKQTGSKLTGTFVLDSTTTKLVKGSIPGVTFLTHLQGPMRLTFPEKKDGE